MTSQMLEVFLFQAQSDWKNVDEIVSLSFKAVHKIISTHHETIMAIEKVLPEKVSFHSQVKANKEEVRNDLRKKADTNVINKTMEEIAENLEQRVSFKDLEQGVERRFEELQFQIQNKVSFEEFSQQIQQLQGQIGRGNSQNESTYHLDGEMQNLRVKVEELEERLHRRPMPENAGLNEEGLQAFQGQFDEIFEKLAEKANKQSVAQALHRKANRQDIDAILAQKTELEDLQRVTAALESKIDVTSFESLVRAVNSKAEKSDVEHMRHQEPAHNSSTVNEKDSILREQQHHLDRAVQKVMNDLDQKVLAVQRDWQLTSKDFATELENLKQAFNVSLTKKVDYRDFDSLNNQLNQRAELPQVQEMVSAARNEVMNQVLTLKKDVQTKAKKRQEDEKKQKKESDFAYERAFEEIGSIKDKMTKLATTFDKELAEREKQQKALQQMNHQDIQKAFNTVSSDIEGLRKTLLELQARSSERKELLDLKGKLMAALDGKVAVAEMQSSLSNCQGDLVQKIFDIRSELFDKIGDIQSYMSQHIGKKVTMEEVQGLLANKVDYSALRSAVDQKANIQEVEAAKQLVEKLIKELELKSNYRDFEGHVAFTKTSLQELSKDLLLKVDIKDMCTLLDTKANVEDINRTLALVQQEVEKSVEKDQLRKALDEQALINEAICAENCVGRWIWKSGELTHSGQIPWETQSVNTCPDNFIWEKNKTAIVCVAPGLYQMVFGLYSKKSPTAHVYVNGEAILVASKDNQNGALKVQNVGRHSAGNITGLTYSDFVALPARSRLSIQFSCDSQGEGFFMLRKL